MIVSSIPWMDDGTPTPNRKRKRNLPFPLSPKPKKKKKLVAAFLNACLKFLLWANTPSYQDGYLLCYWAEWAIP
jgi:hypothetical protein